MEEISSLAKGQLPLASFIGISMPTVGGDEAQEERGKAKGGQITYSLSSLSSPASVLFHVRFL